MTSVLVAIALLQNPACTGEAARHVADAVRLGQEFDLNGASNAYAAAAKAGCVAVQPAALYVWGLVAGRVAEAQFGSAASLQPLKQAIGALEPYAAADPVVRVMQAVLRAAMPAAQHERPEMALLIDEMLRRESIQLEAKQPGLPVISAHEAAGYFWLQLHVYDEAAKAFELASRRIGQTPHVVLGLARTAAGRADRTSACGHYKQLVSWWGSRTGSPAEITEARAYLKQPSCTAPVPSPSPRSNPRPTLRK